MVQYRNDNFANTFLTTNPKIGIHTVQEKLRQSSTLEAEFAQYFKERAVIEDQYAKSLVKASKKLYVMDRSALGGLAPVWDLLHDELTEISTAHGIISYKILNEIEHSLKSPVSDDINKIKMMEPKFQQIAKEYDAGLKNKSGKSSIFKSVSKSHSDSALSKWTAEGNSFLQLYENVERARLERLKSLITNFEHIYTDQLNKRLDIANNILNATNEFDVNNEITEFCKSKSLQMNTLTSSASLSNLSTRNVPESTDNYSHSLPIKSNSSDAISSLSAKKLKGRSRFSMLIKPRKSSSTTTNSSKEQYVISSIPESNEYNEDIQPNFLEPTLEQDNDASPSDHKVAESPLPMKETPVNEIIDHVKQTPNVDSEGYSVPPPDRFSQYILETQDNESYNDISGLQKFKIDIKSSSVQSNDNNQVELEKATLTRVSSILRENKPTISQRRRGRRQNTKLSTENSDIERGLPSPLITNSDSTPSSLNINSTLSTDIVTNPFRQITPTSEHTNFSSSMASSPTLSLERSLPPPLPSSTTSSRIRSKLSPSPSSLDNNKNQPILHISLTEVVHITQPESKHATIIGQIKLIYNGPILSKDTTFKIRFKNIQQIKPIHPSVIQINDSTSSFDRDNYYYNNNNNNNIFMIPITVFEVQNKGVFIPFFHYQHEKQIEETLPIILEPHFRHTEDNIMMMLKYKLINQYDHCQFMICTDFNNDHQHHISQVQSNPEGLWNHENQLFSWKGKDIIQHDHQLTQPGNQQPRRLLAKFITNPNVEDDNKNQSISPQITLKYYCKDQPPISGILMESSLIIDNDQYDYASKFQQEMDQLIVKSGTILIK